MSGNKGSAGGEPLGPKGKRAMRLAGLVRKEFLQILRDPSSIAIAFLMPIVLLLLFGYAVSLDAEHVPIALVIERPSAEATSLAGAFAGSRYFEILSVPTMAEGIPAVTAHRVDGIVHLRSDFAGALQNRDGTAIQVIVNGVDANTARIIAGYVEGVWGKWLEALALSKGQALVVPVEVKQRVWFNSEMRSRNFLVPGLIAVIMTLIGALLTAMVVAREWERGTMESLMVTPVAMPEILAGKLIPYFVLGTGGMAITVAMALWLFEVPLHGSFWVLLAAASLFLLTALGMGLLISTVTKNQFVAGQVAIISTFLPAFLLSAFIFDVASMPWVVRVLTHFVAARYFVAILQTVFLAGDVWSVILPNGFALMAMAAVFLGLSWRKSRKRLE
jgi:ABC-2 type transport system permease protein